MAYCTTGAMVFMQDFCRGGLDSTNFSTRKVHFPFLWCCVEFYLAVKLHGNTGKHHNY